MRKMWYFYSPRAIVFGRDALEHLESLEAGRVLIVTDSNLERLGMVETVTEHIEKTGAAIQVYDGVEPEPSISIAEEGAKMAVEFQPDLIVALGGGSCIDSAKAIWVLYERPDMKLEDVNPFVKLNLRRKAKLAAIPTTSGTGSEVTWAMVITDEKRKVKMEIASREIIPDIAIVDPHLTKTLPPRLTAETAMDALTHAIEAYTVQWKNDFSDGLALKAIQLIMENVKKAYQNGGDMEAREKLHNAATIAGLAFSNSQIGAVHALAHSFGAVFKVPHATCVSIFLPYIMEYNLPAASKHYAEIADYLGVEAETQMEMAKALIERVKRLREELEIPKSISELEISHEQLNEKIDELIAKAYESIGTTVNPREPTAEDYRKILQHAYKGEKINF